VYYTLAKADQDVTLEFLDGRGAVIRTFKSRLDSLGMADSVRADSVKKSRADSLRSIGKLAETPNPQLGEAGQGEPEADFEERARSGPRPPRVPNKAGLNTFAWDLRYPDAVRFENMIMWAGATTGPIVPPGTYAVRLTVPGQAPRTQPLRVLKDPRSTATQADYDAQVALQRKILDRVSEANNAVRTIRNVKWQLGDRERRASGAQAAAYKTAADDLARRISAVEGEIYQVRNQSSQDPLNYPIKLNNKLAALAGVVATADGRPTAQSYVVLDTLSKRLDVQLGKLRTEMASLDRINAMLKEMSLPPIVPSTVEMRAPRTVAATMEDDDEETEKKKW
jgi:hypothetical protein